MPCKKYNNYTSGKERYGQYTKYANKMENKMENQKKMVSFIHVVGVTV